MGKILAMGISPELETLLRKEHQVLSVADGKAALICSAQEKPDLILLQGAWPGVEMKVLLKNLREVPGQTYVPILLLTSNVNPEEMRLAFEQGASDYVALSGHEDEVLLRVRVHLQTYQRYQEAEAARVRLESQIAELVSMFNVSDGRESARLLSICAWCYTRVEPVKGHWVSLEQYLKDTLGIALTHGICPECLVEFMQSGTNGKNAAQAGQQSHTTRILKGSSR